MQKLRLFISDQESLVFCKNQYFIHFIFNNSLLLKETSAKETFNAEKKKVL